MLRWSAGDPFAKTPRQARHVRGALSHLPFLPQLELPEELVLLLLRQQQATAGLLALIDEARKDRLELRSTATPPPSSWSGKRWREYSRAL